MRNANPHGGCCMKQIKTLWVASFFLKHLLTGDMGVFSLKHGCSGHTMVMTGRVIPSFCFNRKWPNLRRKQQHNLRAINKLFEMVLMMTTKWASSFIIQCLKPPLGSQCWPQDFFSLVYFLSLCLQLLFKMSLVSSPLNAPFHLYQALRKLFNILNN